MGSEIPDMTTPDMTTPDITTPSPAISLPRRMAVFAADIKISHTVFALPWALLSMVLAAHRTPGGLTIGMVALIVLCMVTARTAAMSANRLLDARLDARNPRTKARAIPGGRLSVGFVGGAWACSAVGFILGCLGFWLTRQNPWPLVLSPFVLAFICAYPLLKRFTRLCHYYLGAALGLGPICAWIAVRGDLSAPPLLMSAAVLLWTAGFDIIYACQDFQSDREMGLFSVPAKIGIGPALWVSRLTHLLCLVALVALGLSVPEFGILYWIATGTAGVLLFTEQSLVRADDLSKVGLAFFTVNGVISVLIGFLGVVDVIRH
jgi:4-hydroxybenzoate polyprenyltransferase